MQRRSFLSSLAALAATAALDPEKLLWTPGAKTIFIPPYNFKSATLREAFNVGDIISFGGNWQMYRVIASARSSLVIEPIPPTPPEFPFIPLDTRNII